MEPGNVEDFSRNRDPFQRITEYEVEIHGVNAAGTVSCPFFFPKDVFDFMEEVLAVDEQY
jgi:hypothetical protein